MSTIARLVAAGLTLSAGLAHAAEDSAPQAALYTCTDSAGKKLTSSKPMPVCVLSEGVFEAPSEQMRRDRDLLARYPDGASISNALGEELDRVRESSLIPEHQKREALMAIDARFGRDWRRLRALWVGAEPGSPEISAGVTDPLLQALGKPQDDLREPVGRQPMSLASFLQLVAACTGIVGSLFFAIGVVRQTSDAMAHMAGTYWDSNPHVVAALAAQKADYLFGGGIILLAFVMQLLSFLPLSDAIALSSSRARLAVWCAVPITAGVFAALVPVSARLAARYAREIEDSIDHRQAAQSK